MDKESNSWTMTFAVGMCVVLAVLLAGTYTALKPNVDENVAFDRQINVLIATGLHEKGQKRSRGELEELFEKYIRAEVLEVVRGEKTETVREGGETKDVTVDAVVGMNKTDHAVADLPLIRLNESRKPPAQRKEFATFFTRVDDAGAPVAYCIPISGMGLWGLLYGYLALSADVQSVAGITFYQHKETPGLGGEVDNPNWQAQWEGKRLYDAAGEFVSVIVKKGMVDDTVPFEKQHMVDGLSGATITSNGVTRFVRGDLQKYTAYFDKLKGD